MLLRHIFKRTATFPAAQYFIRATEFKHSSGFVWTQFLIIRYGFSSDSQYHAYTPLVKSTRQASKHAHHVDLPHPLPRGEKKPYPTPMKELIRRAKEQRNINRSLEQTVLNPPENGLLIPELVQVSHEVYQARNTLLEGVVKLLNVLSVHKCRFCPEVHIGHEGHELRTCQGPKSGSRNARHVWTKGIIDHVVAPVECFHLYDRVGNPVVTHNERLKINRIPSIVELCIQAGLDLKDCPTRRRVCPVYMIAGRIIDFEPFPHPVDVDSKLSEDMHTKEHDMKDDIPLLNEAEIQETSQRTLEAWERMRAGARELMKKYSVKTCGYCPEVQVGPKGHKARMCKAPKHQFRDGQHAWQEATLDDLIPPIYVWHVRNPNGPPLKNEMRKYYGKAPALVELCVQGGAVVPDEYKSMMRLDVVLPAVDEADIVA